MIGKILDVLNKYGILNKLCKEDINKYDSMITDLTKICAESQLPLVGMGFCNECRKYSDIIQIRVSDGKKAYTYYELKCGHIIWVKLDKDKLKRYNRAK